MKSLLPAFILLLSFATLGCQPPDPLPRVNPGDANSANAANNSAVTEGKALYDRYCKACHGDEGLGAAIWAGSIQGYDPIDDIVFNGRGDMPPVAVNQSEVDAIQAYLNSFGVDLSALSGAQLFAAQCATCHGDNGEGNADGPVIAFNYRPYAEWVIRNGRDGAGYPSAMPAYPDTQVSATQLQEILDFLHSRPRPTTGEGLYDTFCGHCHGAQGNGGIVNKPIAGRTEIAEDVRNKGGTNYGDRLFYMPAWTTSELPDAEVGLIADYLGTFPAP